MKIYRLAEDVDVPEGFVLVEVLHDGSTSTGEMTKKPIAYGKGQSCKKVGRFQGKDAGLKWIENYGENVFGSEEEIIGSGYTKDYFEQQGVRAPAKTAPQVEAPYANTPQRRQKEDELQVDLGI
jgi:hypothetical protein